MGQGSLPEVRVGEPSGRSETGRGTLRNVWDGAGDLGEVRDWSG